MAREPALDVARTVATILVVATHAALSYMVTPIGWAIQDDSHHLGVDLYVWIVRAFIMPTFFWLSGYFSCAVHDRGGLRGFIRNRATRIVLPLAVALVPCSLALDALWDWGRQLAGRPEVAAQVPKLDASTLPVTLGHLWFLYYLVILSACAIAVVAVVRRFRVPTGWLAAGIGVAALGPLLAEGTLQLDTPLGFTVHPTVALYCGAFFGWGWLARARPELLAALRRFAWWSIAASPLLLLAVMPALLDGADPLTSGRAPAYAILASGAFTLTTVAAFLGLCMRSIPTRAGGRAHPIFEVSWRASYWVYIAHLPLVVLLQIAFSMVAWPGPLELVAIVAITLTVCITSYALIEKLRG